MCEPTTIALVGATLLAAGGQVYSGLAANAQGKYENAVQQQNAKFDIEARDDARRRGETEQLRHYRQLSQRLGTQRAQLAASGVDVNFGTAADLQTDTLMLGYEDSQIIGENTTREMRGYEISAANHVMQGRAAKAKGKAAKTAGFISAGATLLGGASQVSKMSAASTGFSSGANFGSSSTSGFNSVSP